MLALSAVLAPPQIARASMDLSILSEAPPGHPAGLRSETSVPVLPMTRFMISMRGSDLTLSAFGDNQPVDTRNRGWALGPAQRLRFISAGYAPYLPNLIATETRRRDLAPLSADGAPTAIFGSVAIPVAGSVHAGRWRQVLSEQAHAALAAPCYDARHCGGALMQEARRVVENARELERAAKIKLINQFVNSTIRYATDREIYDVADHWATLAETFARGRGDCEDFAIAKMWLLRAAGIDLADMHLSLGLQTRLRQDHAILVVKAEPARNFYLDNLTSNVELTGGRDEFQPLLSYGARGVWIHGFRVAARQS